MGTAVSWTRGPAYPAPGTSVPSALRQKAYAIKQDSDLYQAIFLRSRLLILGLLWVNVLQKEAKLFVKIPSSVCTTLSETSCGFLDWLSPWQQFHSTGESEVYPPKGPGLAKVCIPWFCLLIFTEISLLLFREHKVRRRTVVIVVYILKIEAGSMNSRNKNEAIAAEIQ